MNIDNRYRKNTNNTIADVPSTGSGHQASVTMVAAAIAAAVILVVSVMIGIGSVPFPN